MSVYTAAFILEFSLFLSSNLCCKQNTFLGHKFEVSSLEHQLCSACSPSCPVYSCFLCFQPHITETHLDSVIFHFVKHGDAAYKQLQPCNPREEGRERKAHHVRDDEFGEGYLNEPSSDFTYTI